MAEKTYVPVNQRKPSPQVISQRKRTAFLRKLAETGKVAESGRMVGYANTSFLHQLRREDEEFAKAWDEALQAAADRLEDEAVRRAVEGTKKPHVYQGQLCYERDPENGELVLDENTGKPKPIYVTEYSDTLLMFLLRGARPEKFRDNVKADVNISGKIGVAVLPMTASNVQEWEKQVLGMHESQDHITIDGEAVDITDQPTELRGGLADIARA